MGDKHPYAVTPGGLVQVIRHFRKSLPPQVTAETLRKLGFAPKNESYVLNVLQFLGLLNEDGKPTPTATQVFSTHGDEAFSDGFSAVVKDGYSELFELRGDDAWKLDTDDLITFFRQSDQTTEIVGKRQASTFRVLAAFSGHGEVRDRRTPPATTGKTRHRKAQPTTGPKKGQPDKDKRATGTSSREFGLAVRIEVNLPADGDKATYDRIFQSIRENLLNE